MHHSMLVVETLEPRMLLNADVKSLLAPDARGDAELIDTPTADSLVAGLDLVDNWVTQIGDVIGGFSDFEMPFLGSSVDDLISMGQDFGADLQAILTTIRTTTSDFLDANPGSTTDLLAAFITANVDGVTVTDTSPDATTYQFDVGVTLAEVNKQFPIDLIEQIENQIDGFTISGVSAEALANLTADATFNFTVGVDDVGNANDFFLRDPNIALEFAASANFTMGIDFGIFEAELVNATFNFATAYVIDKPPALPDLTFRSDDLQSDGSGNYNYGSLTSTYGSHSGGGGGSSFDFSLPISIPAFGSIFGDLSLPSFTGSSSVPAGEPAGTTGESSALFSNVNYTLPDLSLPEFSDLVNFEDLSFNQLLDNIVSGLNFLFDSGDDSHSGDNPDGIAFKNLPIVNQSLNDLLSIDLAFLEGLGIDLGDLSVQLNAFPNISGIDLTTNSTVPFNVAFEATVEGIRQLGTGLQTLEGIFNDLLNFDGGPVEQRLTLTFDTNSPSPDFDNVLVLDFSFGHELLSEQIDFGMDLADLAALLGGNPFGDVGPLTVSGGGNINLDASATLDLGLGFGFNGLATPTPYVTDASGVTFAFAAVGQNLNMEATVDVPLLGPVGMTIKNGQAALDADGDAGTPDPATVFLGLNEDATDHLYRLSELTNTASYGYAITAGLGIDLPMYFPTESLPMGGSDQDNNNDGIPDNVMQVRSDLGQNGLTNIQVVTPKLGNQFNIFNIFNNPELFVDAFDGVLTALQDGLNGGIFDITLPIIGKISDTTAAQAATQFMADIQSSIIGTYDDPDTPQNEGSGLKGLVQGKTTVEVVQEVIFNLLGPGQAFGTPGLNILVDESNQKIDDPSDVMLEITEDHVQFNIRMADTLASFIVPLSFDAGISGLKLDVDTEILIEMNYVMEFGLGVDFNNLEFYFDTSGATASGAEMALTLDAVLAPSARVERDNNGDVVDFPLEGQLAFLQLAVGDDDDYDPANWRTDGLGERPSGVFGEFALDLLDPDGSNADGERLTISEIQSHTLKQIVEARFNAEADVDLVASVTIPTYTFHIGSASFDLQFPELSTTVHYDQVFVDASTNADADTFGGKPIVTFEDVTLDLGEFITAFISPIIEQVHQVTEPIEPVAELLQQEIGLLKQLGSPATSLLDIAEVALGQTKYAPVVKAIEAIVEVVGFIDTVSDFVDSGADSILIKFGTFTIGDGVGDDLRGSDAANIPAPAPSSGSLDLDRDINNSGGNSGQKQATKEIIKKIGTEPGSFQFPILTNPSSAIGILMGKTVDLFKYDMPALDLNFKYVRSFPIFVGLNARFGGGVTARTNFTFGYDTRGIQAWADGGYNTSPSEIVKIFDGFFIDDHVTFNSPGNPNSGIASDEDEVTLSATIVAGASVGISGLVEAGVEGGIDATIGFNLNDLPEPGTGEGTPNPAVYDGKIRAEELVKRLEQGIECIFDTHGELTAFLDAFFWVGLDLGFFGEITIFEARKRFINETLASFEHHCPDPDPPVIATRSNGVVTLHYQPAEGMADQGERYFVDRMDVPIDPAHPEMGMKNVIRVSSRGFVEDYDPNTVTKIVAFGTGFDDEFVIGENLTADVEIHGGGGNDLIEVQLADPAYSVQLFGDEGNDILMGGPGDDLLVGGSGKDVIGGGPGNDVIFGDDQDSSSTVSLADGADEPVRQLHDQIAGGDGDDEIHGGIGNDLILGEAGNDTIFGDGGLDEISGGDDNDVIHGGDGDDILKGDEGTDTIFGEKGNDTITGGLNADTMIGGPGADTFQWAYGDGNDVSVIGGSSLAQDPDSGGFFEETDTYAVSHEAVFDDTVTVTPSEPDNVRFEFSGSDNLLVGIERLSIEVGEGADDVVVHSLINTTVTDVDIDFGISENEIILEEPLVYTAADFNDPNDPLIGTPVLDGEGNPIMAQLITVESAKDARRDRLHLYGTPGNDAYDIGTPEDPLNPDIGESIFINHTVIGLDRNTTYSITNSENTLDELIVEARPLQGATSNGLAGANGAPATGDGQDRIDAFQVTKDLAEWTFITGTEDDTITATPFADVIDSGSGNDTVTGGLGVDLFFDADGQDTLIEMRDEADLVFRLSDTQLQAGTEIENLHHLFEMVRLVALNNSNAPGEIHEDDEVTIGELSLPLFKIGIPDPNESLYDNEFYVSNWTGRAELDGGEGADLYVIELSGEGDPSVTALVDITDTGTKGLDRVEILGTDEVDTFAFRADVIERIVFADQGGFSRVVEFNTDITTRDSSSAAGFRQAVNYLSVENIYVKGGDGNDLFVVDDTSSEVFLYGEGGEDLFFVGNVISTKEFEDPRLGIIDIVDEITNGVTFPAVVHGGEGDDYFEVNHNVAPIALFGENGDDIFFLRAHLTTEPGTNKTMATSGAEMHVTTQEDEQDVLSYVKNAPVKIHGGAGFDTLAIVGTAADDTFTIFVEEEDGKLVQRIFGAGLIVPEIEEIEQLVIVTGGGDDSVFVYGLLPNQNIRINTGSDNDTVYLGGQEVSFDVIIPEFQRTVTKVIPAYREETVTEVLRPAYTYPKVTYPHHILGITLPIPVIELVHVPASTRTRTIQVRDPENDQVIPEVITVPEQVIPVTMPETRELTSLQGIVTIESLGAEFGSNTLIVNNQYALAENSIGVMTTDRDSLGYLHGLGMGDNGVVFENFDHVEVNLGDHDDRFTIEATLEETTTVVDGGGGNDAFFMGDIVDLIDTNPILADRAWGRNRLQQSEGAVTFHGGAGINVLNLSDADDGRSNKGLITGGLVSLLGLARNQENLGVRYTRMSELNLTLGDGSNELVIESTHGLATTVVSGSGNDTISVLAVSGNTTIQTGSGDDIVQVGSIHPELGGTLAEIKASLFIDTGLDDGTDRLVVDDSGDETFNEGQLHSDAILGLGIVGELRFANIEDMQVHLGSGGNLFAVAGTTTGTTRILGHVGQEEIQVRQIDGPTTIETGDGNDTIRVGAGSHDDVSTLNGINAGLTVLDEGVADTDLLLIDDTAYSLDQQGTLNDNLLTGLGLSESGIMYDGVEALEILLGAGNHTMLVENTHTGMTTLNLGAGQDTANIRRISGRTIIQTGAGENIVNVGSLAPEDNGAPDEIDAELLVEGQGDLDVVNVDVTGNDLDNKAVLTESTLTGLGIDGVIQYADLERLNIFLGAGRTAFNVRGTSAETNIYFNDGDGRIFVSSDADFGPDDAVDFLNGNLDHLMGPLNLHAGSGQNRLAISDAQTAVAKTDILLTNSQISGLSPAPIAFASGDATGSFADGIVIWTGSGDNVAHVTGAPRHDSVPVSTILHMGLGDDQVFAALDEQTDGPFVLDTQGHNEADNATDADVVDASASTLDLIIDGGLGNDDITGGSGDDIIIGGDGADIIRGGAGDDNLAGDFGLYENGVLPLVRSNETGTGGNDEIHGDAGNDFIFGQQGDDQLFGGDGDDNLIGQEGNDTLFGEAGHDILLADMGAILPDFDEQGLPRFNANGSLRRNVFLEETATIIDVIPIHSSMALLDDPELAQKLIQADQIIVTGAIDPTGAKVLDPVSGAWATYLVLLDLNPANHDVLDGGAGDDLLFGQRGNDTLSGGDDNDALFGDRASNTVPFVTDLPHIANGIRLLPNGNDEITLAEGGSVIAPPLVLQPQDIHFAAPFALDNSFGAVLPAAYNALLQSAGVSFLPLGTNLLQPFASMVPDVIHHTDVLAGNDTLNGNGGDDLIFGDNGMVYAELIGEINTLADARDGVWDVVHTLQNEMHHLALDYRHEETQSSNSIELPHDIVVGQDLITGGDGVDQIFGDEGVLVQTFQQAVPEETGRFIDQTVQFFSYLRDLQYVLQDASAAALAAHHQTITEMMTSEAAEASAVQQIDPDHHDLFIGNDSIFAGRNEDLAIGDSGILISVLADGRDLLSPNGQVNLPGKVLRKLNRSLNKLERQQDKLLNTHLKTDHDLSDVLFDKRDVKQILFDFDYDLHAGNNTVSGGDQADFLVGNMAVFVTPVVPLEAMGDTANTQQVRKNVNNLIKDVQHLVNEKFDRQYSAAKSNTPYDNRGGRLAQRLVSIGNDNLLGDEGADVLFGDSVSFSATFQSNSVDPLLINLNTPFNTSGLSTVDRLHRRNEQFDRQASLLDSDALDGGTGAALFFGQWGNDQFAGGDADSILFAGSGADSIGDSVNGAARPGGNLPGEGLHTRIHDTLTASWSVFGDYLDTIAGNPMADSSALFFDPLTGLRLNSQALNQTQTTLLAGGNFLTTAANPVQPAVIELLGDADLVSGYAELFTALRMDEPGRGVEANGFIVFDYHSETDFKFAGISAKANKLLIGSRTNDGWIVEDQSRTGFKPGQDYDLRLILNGSVATLLVDDAEALTHQFDGPLSAGQIGVATQNSVTHFRDFRIQDVPSIGIGNG